MACPQDLKIPRTVFCHNVGMPNEHSQFPGIKKSIVGICFAVVICSAGTALAGSPNWPPDGEALEACDDNLATAAQIGMTPDEVLDALARALQRKFPKNTIAYDACMPSHKDINVTVTAAARREQWVFRDLFHRIGDQFLYFENGRLVSMQVKSPGR